MSDAEQDWSDAESERRKRVAPALGKVASGLYILTLVAEGKRHGMLCSFVEQAGFQPPMLTVALGSDRPVLARLEPGFVFGLNVLGKENGALMKPFARPVDGDAFEGLVTDEPVSGAIRLGNALAFLACRARGRIDGVDHAVVLAEILDGSLHGEGEPMVRVRRDGFGY